MNSADVYCFELFTVPSTEFEQRSLTGYARVLKSKSSKSNCSYLKSTSNCYLKSHNLFTMSND